MEVALAQHSDFMNMTTPLIHIIDDDPLICSLVDRTLRVKWGYRSGVFHDGAAYLAEGTEIPDLLILDLMLDGLSGIEVLTTLKKQHPDLPILILSSQSDINVAVDTMRRGAYDYFTKPVDFGRLEFSIRNALQLQALREEVQSLRDSLESNARIENIVTGSGVMHDALRLVVKARDSEISVLIEGESGTGKEMIARAIHYTGRRSAAPFVVVNCAAIPKDLIESELFGHEKGAFTGADARRRGRFEQADGGTLFLDEIGELDISLQAKLLRAIQQKQFERVGGGETITVDVRIVSATNRNLKLMCEERSFREDLYYRLAAFPILLPPLRERRGDILLLADHFLRNAGAREAKDQLRFSPEALQLLQAYHWPGNVRELQSAIDRAVLLADSTELRVRDFPMLPTSDEVLAPQSSRQAVRTELGLSRWRGASLTMEQIKEHAIRDALRAANGVQAAAARSLDIGRTTLFELMRKYRIDAKDFL